VCVCVCMCVLRCISAMYEMRVQPTFPRVGFQCICRAHQRPWPLLWLLLQLLIVWWRGELNGATGLFLKTSVQLMSTNEQTEYLRSVETDVPPPTGTAATTTPAGTATKAEQEESQATPSLAVSTDSGDLPLKAVAITDYAGVRNDELTFAKGALINVISQQDRWWVGELDQNGARGRFPVECVKVLNNKEDMDQATDLSRRRSATRAARRVPLAKAEMLFDFEGGSSAELTVKAGDHVNVLNYLEGVPGGWWKGEFEGRVGHFPKDFAKVIEVLTPDQMDEHYQKNLQAQEKQSAKRKPNNPIARLCALYDYKAGSANEVSFSKG
jgi:SH3 domain